MTSLPIGIVTFLFTDIEGSTKIWEEYPVKMQEALRQHDEILATIFVEHGGMVVKERGEGDSFFVVFSVPSDAVRAACLIQEKLAQTEWPVPQPLRVRMALHSGEAELRDGDYYGTAVNRCARLRAIAHGGQVVLSEVTAQLAKGNLPSEMTLLDLGSHGLKDLSTPEQVFQLVHPDLPETFPPLRSLHSRQHNLPVQATSFIGRESQLKELHARLHQTRLLSLLGPGGTGKTRLSLQLAAESAEEFPDGVWLAELAPLQDHSLLYQTVASIFGIKGQNHLSQQEVLTNYLESKMMLLVLDNCEHLIEQCAMLAANVIQKCPGVKMIITSREPLNITGETIWRVPSLSLPNPADPLSIEQLLQYEAVQLFVNRALSVQHSFTVTTQNASAIVDICHRLDGIPLALELAAARVKSLTVEQIAQRLSESFRLLSGGDRTRLPRQQTLRALVDWSYDLLNETERILWRRLSVFAGSFRLEAAETVCSGEGVDEFEVIDLLGQLVDKSLVISEEREGEVRYRLLTTIRQYGEEKLNEAGERDIVLEKHCDYYLAFIEKTAAGLRSPHMQAATVQEWAREIDNLRVAMDWSQQLATVNPLFAEKAGRLISASPFFWQILGIAREGHKRLQVWLALPNCSAQTNTRAAALLVATSFSVDADLKQASLYIQESIEIARKLGDSLKLAKGLSFMGYAYNLTGQFQKAIELMDEAYAILQEAKIDWEMTELLRLKGFVLLNKQDLTGVKATAEQNLNLCRQLGNTHEEAATLRTFGILAMLDRQVSEAKQYFQESLAITCDLGDKQCTYHGLGGISLVAEACSEKELAAWLGGAFESFAETNGYGVGMYISPTANEIWTALKADLPEIWAYGRKASYDETVAKAKSFVAEMK